MLNLFLIIHFIVENGIKGAFRQQEFSQTFFFVKYGQVYQFKNKFFLIFQISDPPSQVLSN